jgi:hypothetical protein
MLELEKFDNTDHIEIREKDVYKLDKKIKLLQEQFSSKIEDM